MSASIKRKNPNAVSDLIKFTKMLEKKAAYVGYPASVDGELVHRAATHQFGSIEKHIPPRPFLDKGVEEGAEKYQKYAKSKMSKVLTGDLSVGDYYKKLGTMASSEVKKYIREGTFTPLSPYTIEKKGSSKPLIDTGQMRNVVTYEVRDD